MVDDAINIAIKKHQIALNMHRVFMTIHFIALIVMLILMLANETFVVHVILVIITILISSNFVKVYCQYRSIQRTMEVSIIPRKDQTGPSEKSTGPRDGRGKGQGQGGKGIGSKKGGNKGSC